MGRPLSSVSILLPLRRAGLSLPADSDDDMEDRRDRGVAQSQNAQVSDDGAVVIKKAQTVFGKHHAYCLLVQF
jgi:hypothetical protein